MHPQGISRKSLGCQASCTPHGKNQQVQVVRDNSKPLLMTYNHLQAKTIFNYL